MPFLELSKCNKAMCQETSVPQRAGLRTHGKSRLNLGTILHYKITKSFPSVYVLKCVPWPPNTRGKYTKR